MVAKKTPTIKRKTIYTYMYIPMSYMYMFKDLYMYLHIYPPIYLHRGIIYNGCEEDPDHQEKQSIYVHTYVLYLFKDLSLFISTHLSIDLEEWSTMVAKKTPTSKSKIVLTSISPKGGSIKIRIYSIIYYIKRRKCFCFLQP